jgi:ribonuclease E
MAPDAIAATDTEEGESEEDEAEEQPGQVRADQAAGGERRPRRRGRRGGRRRRGGPEDGLAGSIVDELEPTSVPEATSAVADFDGYTPPEPSLPTLQPESIAPPSSPEPQPADHGQQVARASIPEETAPEETAQEAERAARRRSTVREKVSFLVNAQPEATTSVTHSPAEPSAPPAPAAPVSEASTSEAPDSGTTETQPRRAGWWSRRFGSGE